MAIDSILETFIELNTATDRYEDRTFIYLLLC